MADLPNRIRDLRTARGWSQDTLALVVDCSKMQISELERGLKPLTLNWMRRIARALEVTPGELLNPDDNPLNLSEDERELIERYRHASPENQAAIASVAEALSGWRPPKKHDEAA